jgi:DNA-binding IclR family transcriptional regulator
MSYSDGAAALPLAEHNFPAFPVRTPADRPVVGLARPDLSEDRPSLGAVEKAMMVLAEVIADGRPIGLAELTRRTGLAKPTVHRLIATLRAYRMIEQHDGKYLPGQRLAEFGQPTAGSYLGLLKRLATPHLVELYQATGQTVSLGVLAGDEVRYLQRICDYRSVRTPSHCCDRAPARRTAIGKALLAYQDVPPHIRDDRSTPPVTPATITSPAALAAELHRVRRTGIAHNREEYVKGVVCVAAPVAVGRRAWPPVAIAVSGKTGQLDLPEASEHLRRTAHVLSTAIRRATAHSVARRSA